MKWKQQPFKTKKTYLEYYKIVLERVSFCNTLLSKEYFKAKKSISPVELVSLNRWLITKKLDKKITVPSK